MAPSRSAPAAGHVKTAIFQQERHRRIYKYEQKPRAALATDRIARPEGGVTGRAVAPRRDLSSGYVVPSRA